MTVISDIKSGNNNEATTQAWPCGQCHLGHCQAELDGTDCGTEGMWYFSYSLILMFLFATSSKIQTTKTTTLCWFLLMMTRMSLFIFYMTCHSLLFGIVQCLINSIQPLTICYLPGTLLSTRIAKSTSRCTADGPLARPPCTALRSPHSLSWEIPTATCPFTGSLSMANLYLAEATQCGVSLWHTEEKHRGQALTDIASNPSKISTQQIAVSTQENMSSCPAI